MPLVVYPDQLLSQALASLQNSKEHIANLNNDIISLQRINDNLSRDYKQQQTDLAQASLSLEAQQKASLEQSMEYQETLIWLSDSYNSILKDNQNKDLIIAKGKEREKLLLLGAIIATAASLLFIVLKRAFKR